MFAKHGGRSRGELVVSQWDLFLTGLASFGVYVVEEASHEGVESLGLVGHGGGKVVRFGEVFGEVEEFEAVFLPGFDEFEVAEAKGGLRVTVDGVVEDEEGIVALDVPLALVVEDGEDAAAIDILRKWLAVTGELCERGEDVESGDGDAGEGVVRDVGSDDGEGDADAAFVHGAFAIAEWVVAGERGVGCFGDGVASAVVGEEEDVGVVGEVELLDLVEDLADGPIDIIGHGGEFGHTVSLAGFPGLGFFECLLVVEDVEVDGVVGDLEEEGCLAGGLFPHEADGLVGDVVHELGVVFGGGAPGAFAAAGTIAGVAVGGVVALVLRSDLVEAVVPLSEVGGLVAGVGRFEHAWDVELLAVLCGPGASVFLVEVARGGLAGLDAASCGAAEGRGGVALGEAHAHGHEAFDVGRLEVIALGLGVLRVHQRRGADPALVVGENKDEAGGRLGECRDEGAGGEQRGEKSDQECGVKEAWGGAMVHGWLREGVDL